MKNFIKLIFLIMLIWFCINTSAQEYYANIEFEIQNQGTTIISGPTNYPELNSKTTQELTSKNGKTWTFLIDTNEIFSEYSYKIILPENTQIQKIETTSTYFLETQNGAIVIEGYGENINLNLKILYTLTQTNSEIQLIPILGGVLILIIIGFILFTQLKKQKNIPLAEGKKNSMLENTFDVDTLSERQLDIVKQLEKKGGKTTQAEIQKILNLPKASLFRNISTLEKKGIIKKERKGMTMLLTLQKKRN